MKRRSTVVVAALGLLLLVACSTTPSGSTSVTVQGTVTGLVASPLPNASVRIGGVTAVTDAMGTFSIDNVTPPYDLTASSVTGNWAHVYEGLSTASPTLLSAAVLGGGLAIASHATVTGTVTTSITVGTTDPLVVCLEGSTQEVYGCSTYTTPTTATTVDYSLSAGWVGTANVAVRVHALQFARAGSNSLPSNYYGYAKTTSATTLVPGGTSASNDLGLSGTTSSSVLSGSVGVPAGVTSAQVLLMARVSPTLSLPLGAATVTGPGYAYSGQVPVFPGATYLLVATGSGSAGTTVRWRQGLTAGPGHHIALATIATPTSVPSSASPGDTFAVANTGGAPLTVAFVPSSSPGAPLLGVTTAQASVTLPGTLPIPSGSSYDLFIVTNPGESLQTASADWFNGYYALVVTSGLAIHDDGGITLGTSSSAFTVP